MSSSTYIKRSEMVDFESAVGKRATDFKSKVDSLKQNSDGVSTADLLSMQYESNFLSMIVDTSSSLVQTVKDTAKTITQKL
ncbi:MAG: Type secretion needle MxiH, YscF, SsaG, EprI, PscF, EscF [Chlamydiales bacterium]|jgi:hypothetical protein|nr:Type secretion needle MxiH, YscF, SsaG, EprI, PscF, EscF [Chlamydiales bacterium]